MATRINSLQDTATLADTDYIAVDQPAQTGRLTLGDLRDQMGGLVSVKQFGAVGDGVADDTAAFQAAATAAGAGNPIYVPSGNYLKNLITNESDYFWICGEALDYAGVNPITLLGHVEQSFANRRLIQKTATTAGEYAEIQLSKSFDYVGGTAGQVASGMVLSTSVSSGVEDFVWNFTSVLNNSANAGENVAIYGQGNRDAGIGPIWAGVFEAKDKTNTSGAGKGGLVGIEVDVFANGTDDASNRIGIDVVVGKGVGGGDACSATYGIKIGPQNGTITNGTFNIGYSATGCVSADYLSQSESVSGFQASGTNTFGVLLDGTHTVGIDLSQATIANQAIRLAAGQQIAFDATGTITVEYDTGGDAILFKKSGVTKHTFLMT